MARYPTVRCASEPLPAIRPFLEYYPDACRALCLHHILKGQTHNRLAALPKNAPEGPSLICRVVPPQTDGLRHKDRAVVLWQESYGYNSHGQLTSVTNAADVNGYRNSFSAACAA